MFKNFPPPRNGAYTPQYMLQMLYDADEEISNLKQKLGSAEATIIDQYEKMQNLLQKSTKAQLEYQKELKRLQAIIKEKG